jgi:hypothetical protein
MEKRKMAMWKEAAVPRRAMPSRAMPSRAVESRAVESRAMHGRTAPCAATTAVPRLRRRRKQCSADCDRRCETRTYLKIADCCRSDIKAE